MAMQKNRVNIARCCKLLQPDVDFLQESYILGKCIEHLRHHG